MLNIKGESEIDLFKKSFIELYENKDDPTDPELFKEDVAALFIDNPSDKDYVEINDERVNFLYNYEDILNTNKKHIDEESICYYNEIIASGKLKDVIDYLKENPLSKRAIISFWADRFRNLAIVSPCTTMIFLRVNDQKLSLHVHMRANDAYRCLLIDIHFFRSLQNYIAKKLNYKIGSYVHFIDSFHFYNASKKDNDRLYEDIKNNKI